MACASRHSGSGAWFVQGDTLSEWMSFGPSALLWIHGKRQLTFTAYYFSEVDGFPISQRALARVCFGTLILR